MAWKWNKVGASCVGLLALTSFTLWMLACEGGAPTSPASGLKKGANVSDDDVPDADMPGDDDGDGPPAASGTDEEDVVFPTLTFGGNGNIQHATANAVFQSLTADMTADELKLNTTRMGSSDSEVNKRISSKTGVTTFKRTTAARLKTFTDIKNVPYLIFADSATVPSGVTYTFSKPFPVYLVPLAKNQYADIDGKSIPFSATVTRSPNNPVECDDRDNVAHPQSFTVNQTVSMTASTDAKALRVHTSLTIPEDRGGEIYQGFPMPLQADYTLDTLAVPRLIMAVSTQGVYCDTGVAGGSKPSTMDLRLCSSAKPGEPAKTFSCPVQ